MDLMKQFINDAADQIARGIDTELLMSMMGWHEVKISTGTVYDQTYHTVQPRSFVQIAQNWFDMENWCTETFGETARDGVWTPDSRWYANNQKFWFKDEADLLLFTLRWS